MRRTTVLIALGMVLPFVVSCESDLKEDATTDVSEQHEQPQSFDFGEPNVPEARDRMVTIRALDALAFDPPDLRVGKGETITFEVTNAGSNRHEFVIGDAEFQKQHEQEMSEGDMSMQHEGNTLVLDPGQTGSLTWTFTQSGVVLYGCHEPGHYTGGMVGTIEVLTA
jgi:plastocyanin